MDQKGRRKMLNNPTKRYCYPDGDKGAKIAFIGEAPGAEEERAGKGFVGQSGELLFRIAAGAGIARADVYCTNVVKERPRSNNIDQFIRFERGQVYATKEYTEYEEYLYNELESVRANVLVAIGNTSLWALARQQHIMKRRGSIYTGHKGRKVIPIVHPAAALRQYLLVHCIAWDMRRIAAEQHFPEVRLPVRNIYIKPSYMDSMAFLHRCLEANIVAFDIEVMRTEVSCISFALSPSEVMSIPFQSGYDNYFTPDQEMAIWRMIGRILWDEGIVKVGQNLAFDSTFLYQRFGIVTRNMEDTMVAQKVMYPDLPKGLDFITSIYTKEPYYKDEGKKWFKFGGNQEDFWIYNAKDSAVCIEALPAIKAKLEEYNNLETYDQQRLLISPLVYMQSRGIKMNKPAMDKESAEAEVKISELTKRLHEVSGYEINPASSKQIQEYFYNIKGEAPYVNRKTHKPTADKDAVKRLSRKGYEEARLLQEISKLSYYKSHFLDVTLDSDLRLRCSFDPVGAKFGRLSSSETIFDTGTNMQNLPEEFRKHLLADDDYMLFNFDLSQAENRIVANIAPEPNMVRAFTTGVDVHCMTGSLISGLPIDEVKKQDKEGIKCPLGGGAYTWRFWGKKANHGLNYDLGYKTFGFYYELPEKDAKFIVERYHLAYPGVRQYHAWVRAALGKSRVLENAFGRKCLFLDRWGDEMFKEAYAFFPQSTVADIINRRGLNYIYYNQQWFKPVELLLQVHDSIVFQMNYKQWSWEEQAECMIRLKESLEQPLRWRGTEFTIPTGAEVGFNLYKKNMMEVSRDDFSSVERLARRLSFINGSLRATLYV